MGEQVAGRVIIVVGPPNAGKGTQVAALAKRLQAVHFSTGDLLRRENRPEVVKRMSQGALAPSDHIRALLQRALTEAPREQAVVFDGAKKLAEAQWVVKFLPTLGRQLERVVSLVISEEEARKRSTGRSATHGRPDDAEHLQEVRWRLYRRDVVPALEFYRSLGLLVEVDALGTPEGVAARLWQALDRAR